MFPFEFDLDRRRVIDPHHVFAEKRAVVLPPPGDDGHLFDRRFTPPVFAVHVSTHTPRILTTRLQDTDRYRYTDSFDAREGGE